MGEKKGSYQIPFDQKGNMQSYPLGTYVKRGDAWETVEPEWRDNTPFEATLEYVGFYRGRSAAGMCFKDAAGHEYPMFMKDFEAVVPFMHAGRVTGVWRGTKRGANYGVQLQVAAADELTKKRLGIWKAIAE
jgi:hypothetical protein